MQTPVNRLRHALSKDSLPAVFISIVLLLAVAVTAKVIEEFSYRSVAEVGRDYSLNPMNEFDATMACKDEAMRRRGELLLRAYVDEISTRFDENIGAYIVVLKADIGVNDNFEENSIICYLYPSTQRLTNYDEVPIREKKETANLRFFK